jgi:hypothetical protein
VKCEHGSVTRHSATRNRRFVRDNIVRVSEQVQVTGALQYDAQAAGYQEATVSYSRIGCVGVGGIVWHVNSLPENCLLSISPIRFEMFTTVTMRNVVFWDVTPCSSCYNRLFVGTYRLHRQDVKYQRARNKVSSK